MPRKRDDRQMAFDLGPVAPGMPADVREVVLAAVATASYGEVAANLGLSKGQVAGAVLRARAAGVPVETRVAFGSPADLARRAAVAIERPARVRVRVLPPTPTVVRERPRSGRARPDMWTRTEDDVLRQGYAAGDTPADIARRLGRTRGGVESRAGHLCLRNSRVAVWDDRLDARLVAMRTVDGLDDAAIAQRLGRSLGSVQSRLSRLRGLGHRVPLQSTSRVWREADLDRLASLWAGSMTIERIAAATGWSRAVVTERIEALRDEGRIPGGRVDDEREPGAVRRPRPGADPLLAALASHHGIH